MTAHTHQPLGSIRQTNTRSGALGLLSFLLASILCLSGLASNRASGSAPSSPLKAKPASPTLRGQEAIDQLKEQGLYSSLQEAMAASRYKAEWQTQTALAGLQSAYELKNSAHNLRAYLTSNELRVVSLSDEAQGSWQLGMTLIGYGYADSLSAITPGEITAKENRVEIQKSTIGNPQSAIVEWCVNSERGIEQGFDIAAAPAGKPQNVSLRLTLELTGSLKARLDEAKQAITLSNCTASLVYSGLEAFDARGRTLAAHMELDAGRVTLVVDDAGAEYPVKIDPLLTQLVKLSAGDASPFDELGWSVAVSGDTAVIGARHDDIAFTDQGSTYIFVRSGSAWTQQQQIIASDGAALDNFGYSVGISGDTLVVGAAFKGVGANSNQGSAYVFVRSGTVWTQQQKLTASDGAAADNFGHSVAIDGDTVVVGANLDDVGANSNQGSAYVFVRSGTAWTQQKKLTASDGAAFDDFGESVAISGDTVIVGSPFDNVSSAYVFVRSGATWTQQQILTATDGEPSDLFGFAVAISSDTVVVGNIVDDVGANPNQGSAYVFVRSGTAWTQQQRLTASDGAADDQFGISVAISGETVVVGHTFDKVGLNTDQGSAYVFVRSGATWTQQQQLTASDGAAGDFFGSVAISGDTVVVGAYGDDADQGSAYIFSCGRTNYGQLIVGDGAADDHFGQSIAISGDTVVVGVNQDDAGVNSDQGSVYVFVRSGTGWTQQQRLTASDGASADTFGESVAISGDTVVVGAVLDDVVFANQGSAYIFVRSGTSWTQQQRLTAGDGGANDQFGGSVAVSGETVVVGAALDNVGFSDQGSAYVFVRSGAVWTQQQQLTASDGGAFDSFGQSVAVSGNTVVVGAQDDGTNQGHGSAYVFVRSGAVWSQQQNLTASDGAAGDQFGFSVAISGETVIVGANRHDGGFNDQGSAYVFLRSGATWTQQQQLIAGDGAASDAFGSSVAINGDIVVVGANIDDVGANFNQGSAYVFIPFNGIWQQQQQLTAPDGGAGDQFGNAVATNGETVVVGSSLNDALGNPDPVVDQGSAYVFFSGCNTAPAIAAAGGFTRQQGSPATLATLATVSDFQDLAGSLTVTAISIPSGVTLSGLANNSGTITALVAAGCNAQIGAQSINLQVADSNGATSTANVVVSVTANTTPALGNYADTSVAVLGSATSTPGIAPSDNGTIVSLTATSPTYVGGLTANPVNGVVTISNARPGGAHFITVTAVDNCGATASQGFILNVTCQAITVNPTTIPAGLAGSGYTQTFTQSGGNGGTTFSLSGTLPAGMAFAGATLSGTPTQVGNFPIAVTASDVNSCTGSRNYTLTISAPLAVWNGNNSSDWDTAANWTPNLVPQSFTDVLIPSGAIPNQPIISNSSPTIHAMTMQTGRILSINSTRQLIAQGDVSTDGQIQGSGKFVFDGTTFTQNGSVSIASVEFDSGAHALTGGGAFASGIVTVLNGASVTLTSNHSVSVIVINSGGAFDATNQTLTLTGAGTPIFNSGSLTATGSTIVYQGSVAQVVTANISYNNLSINNAAGVSLAGDTTATGQLNLMTNLTTGAFTLTMPNTGTSTGGGDVVGNVKRTGFALSTTLSFGDPLNTIQFNSGTVPSEVTMNLVKSAPAGSPANTVTRTYTITQSGGSGFTATMRLRYTDPELNGLNESTLELWRFNGASWVSPADSATRETTANWVQESGIDSFSPWAIAGPSGPTLVELISFNATGYEDGVFIEWQTGLEVDNLGFNIYRDEGGARALVNTQLVAGSALRDGYGLQAGESYAWWDGSANENSVYWLEDVDLKGGSTWHGPFACKQAGGSPPARSNAALLSKLGSNLSQGGSTSVVEAVASLAPGSSAQKDVQSSLGSQAAIKIAVKREGWYRVPQPELVAAGLKPGIDPRYLQLFVDGREIPIYVTTGKGGLFDESSAIEFYGVGLDTSSTDSRIYWLTTGGSEGKRIAQPKGIGAPSSDLSFTQTIERRDRTIYFSALLNGEKENFFGAVVAGAGVGQALTLTHLAERDTSNFETSVEVALQGVTMTAHRVLVQLNGVGVREISFYGQEQGVSKLNINQSLLREGENTVRLIPQNGASDISLVVHIRVSYQHTYTADGDSLKFAATGGQRITIEGFTSKTIRVFDITDADDVQELIGDVNQSQTGYAISAVPQERGLRTLIAVAEDRFKRAESVEINAASSLGSPANAADFVIITTDKLSPAIETLKTVRQGEGYKVAIVDVVDIYDEFNFGHKAPQAIKDFLSFAATNWKIVPRFVLFAGDASFDSRNYLGLGDSDLVPTKLVDTSYLETASDDWFADFNNDGVSDLAIGRLPLRNNQEAAAVVSKLIGYPRSMPSESVVLVSDANDGFNFGQASAQLRALIPSSFKIEEIKRGEFDPLTARTSLLDSIARGETLINYVGHGSANQWRGGLLTSADANALINADRLPMFVMMTCLNGYFHDAALDSLAESLVKAERGGAIAAWASSGMTLPDQQVVINQQLYRLLFIPSVSGKAPIATTLGEATQRAKAAVADVDIRRTWILLGDPTLRLR